LNAVEFVGAIVVARDDRLSHYVIAIITALRRLVFKR